MINQLPHVRRAEPPPKLGVAEFFLGGWGLVALEKGFGQVLAEEEAHAQVVSDEAHDVGRVWGVGDSVYPCELEVGDQESMTAPPAEPRLERHEDPRGRAGAGVAVGGKQLDAGYYSAPQAHVRGERPLGQGAFETGPKRAIVLVAQPDPAVGGLEFDKC